jgi:transposase
MSIVHQMSLFDLDELLEWEVDDRYAELFRPIDFEQLLFLFRKHSRLGPPLSVDYASCLRALIARHVEKIPDIKHLVKRLKEDLPFRLALGFSYASPVPSEASFSRIHRQLSEHLEALRKENNALICFIDKAEAILQEDVAMDSTAVRVYKKSHHEKHPEIPSTILQRKMPTQEILASISSEPSWGAKRNSQGKDSYWFGGKCHLVVSASSQYILYSLYSSAFVNDMSTAIPLMRAVKKLGLKKGHVLMDKGYDGTEIYEEAHQLGLEPIIDRKKPPQNLFMQDKHFAPTCAKGFAYHYDSFDKRYGALKYKRPEHLCKSCPLALQCQKVKKIKQAINFRNYAHPARGSKKWQWLYNQRSSVERVNASLKEGFHISHSRFQKGAKLQAELQLVQLAYNLTHFAVSQHHLNENKKQTVA